MAEQRPLVDIIGNINTITMDKDITWSYSRLNFTCKYNFYKTYVLGDRGKNNFWGELGGALHNLLEQHAKGELTAKEVTEAYDNSFYDLATPPDTDFDYYASANQKMWHYFHRSKFWKGEVVAAEYEVNGTLPSGEKLTGFIDLILNPNSLDFIDHKSSSGFKPHEIEKKKHQQYLYAYIYHQMNGVYPKRLIWDFFKLHDKPFIVEFDYNEMMKSVDWAEGQIRALRKLMLITDKMDIIGLWMPDLNYPPEDPIASPRAKNRNFFCANLCGHRNSCPFVNGKGFNESKFELSQYSK